MKKMYPTYSWEKQHKKQFNYQTKHNSCLRVIKISVSSRREDLHQLKTSRCLGGNDLSKGMIKILESLIHMLMRVYYSGTLLKINVRSIEFKLL